MAVPGFLCKVGGGLTPDARHHKNENSIAKSVATSAKNDIITVLPSRIVLVTSLNFMGSTTWAALAADN